MKRRKQQTPELFGDGLDRIVHCPALLDVFDRIEQTETELRIFPQHGPPRPCGWSGPLDETEVGGADDGYVFCPRCDCEFSISTGEENV